MPGLITTPNATLEQNTTCVHLRINDKFMESVGKGQLDIATLAAVDIVDVDNFGCSWLLLWSNACNYDAIQNMTFQDYLRSIVRQTAASKAPNLYIMSPPGLDNYTRHLGREFGVRIFGLSDFTTPDFAGRDSPHADRIMCSKATLFAGTKSSFSSVTKMMRGYKNWVWLHQYYNISACLARRDLSGMSGTSAWRNGNALAQPSFSPGI
jgi:hypothetical protein